MDSKNKIGWKTNSATIVAPDRIEVTIQGLKDHVLEELLEWVRDKIFSGEIDGWNLTLTNFEKVSSKQENQS